MTSCWADVEFHYEHLSAGLSRGRQWDLSCLQVIHSVPLLRSWTPVEPMCPCLGGHIDAAPACYHNEGFGRCGFRGSLTQLQHLLSYASRFVLPFTRKAGFWLAGLYREGVKPSGSLRKVSNHMVIPLSCPPDAR